MAMGKVEGGDVVVLCETIGDEWQFLFNGETNNALEKKIRQLMQEDVRIGNYIPKTMKLKLCGIFDGVLFFDRDARQTKVYGEIEQIPFKDGVIY